jgi:uncharacterized protein (TIGR03437 family)
MRKSTLFLFFTAFSCGLLPGQTLTMLSGNGQLDPDSQYNGGEPLVFKVTASSDPNSAGLPGQLITFTTSNGIIPLNEYSVVTGSDGTASVQFLSAPINAGPSYIQFTITASLSTKPPVATTFYETSYYVAPGTDFQYAQTQLVSPTNLTSATYAAQAGSGGTPIQLRIYASGGNQSGQSIGNVAVRAVLLPPYGTGATVQSVRCKEANPADYEGNVYSGIMAGSMVTCTPIFALPNEVFAPGTNSFQFEMIVGDQFAYGPITYNVTVAPVTLAGGLVNAEAPFPATQLVVGGGLPPYTFSIAGGTLPAGVSLNPQTGVVTGTPTGTPGIYSYTVRAQDSTGTSATLPQSIAVSSGPITPSANVLSAYAGEKVSSTITFTGGVPPLTVKTVTGLPAGFTDTIQSGGSVLISGTAPAVGAPVPVSFSVMDATGAAFPVIVDFQVSADLTVTGPNPQTVLVGASVTNVTVVPANGVPPYTFTATGLPTGLGIAATTGVISGTVTATPGVYTANVTVTDSLGEVQTLMPVFYVETSALAIVPASVPPAFAALPYTATLQFTGGVPLSSTPPYTVVLGANPPAGITLTNGVLTGIFPTAGTVNVPVVVTDGTGVSTAIHVAIVVQSVAVVNAASFINGSVVAPGEIVSIFGSGFGPAAGVSGTIDATTGNLVTTLAGVQVLFGGTAAPIFFENAGQINVQVPFELTAGSKVPVVVSINGTPYTVIASLPVAESNPGLFADFPATGYVTGAPIQAIALNYPAATLNSSTNPVARGSYIVLYATGGGTLSAPLSDGMAASTDPLITLTDNPQVTIGGQPATVSFAGLAPGFIGLIQVNVLVPETVTPGSAVPVVLTFGGAGNQSENATIAVQ